MTDLREFSKLPEDRAYWASLEARIVAGLDAPAAAAPARAPWWSPLAAHAWGLSGLAAAAAIVALVLVPVPATPSAASSLGLLGPPAHDPTVAAFVASPEPPALGALLLFEREGGR